MTNFGASHGATALKDSPSEKRVIKHLERAIKDKLFKAGLDTGGRQIEVKFITTSIPSEVFGGKEDGGEGVTDESMTSEEARQFQGMIYNLMVSFFQSLYCSLRIQLPIKISLVFYSLSSFFLSKTS